MLQALVITLREGVEAALIIAITLACLDKIAARGLRRVVFGALGTAIAGSVAAAAIISKVSFNRELFEGLVMLVAAFFVVTMVIFMSRASRTLKGDIEKRVGAFTSAGSRLGLFLFVFFMVLREGVETVLILSAFSFSSNELLGFLGTLTGIAFSVVFGFLFVRGTLRIDLRKFFRVTTVILIFVAAQLTVSGLHELSEAGVIPSTRRQMALIGPVVRNDVFFFVTMLALAGLMVLFESRRQSPATSDSSASHAEQRKAAWSARRERLWSTAVYASSFVFILLITAQFIYAKSASSLSPATVVTFLDRTVVIDAAQIQNGELRRYEGTLGEKPVRFLIYRKPDGALATILDACAICGPVGFYRTAQGISCKNCEAPVNPDAVGEAGGCNPVPLASKIEGSRVTVREDDLASSAAQVKE